MPLYEHVFISRQDLSNAQAEGLVEHFGPNMAAGLPQGADGPLSIGDEGHPARVHDVHCRDHDHAPGGHPARQGGVEAIAEVNQRKSDKLYSAIDDSAFYTNPVNPDCRSRMNVPFILADDALDATFLEESAAAGLTNLKGHRSVGGMRASIYNAVSEEAVDALIAFMAEFEKRHG